MFFLPAFGIHWFLLLAFYKYFRSVWLLFCKVRLVGLGFTILFDTEQSSFFLYGALFLPTHFELSWCLKEVEGYLKEVFGCSMGTFKAYIEEKHSEGQF